VRLDARQVVSGGGRRAKERASKWLLNCGVVDLCSRNLVSELFIHLLSDDQVTLLDWQPRKCWIVRAHLRADHFGIALVWHCRRRDYCLRHSLILLTRLGYRRLVGCAVVRIEAKVSAARIVQLHVWVTVDGEASCLLSLRQVYLLRRALFVYFFRRGYCLRYLIGRQNRGVLEATLAIHGDP